MTFLRACTLACLCTLPLVAAAQWQWVDKDGRRVFSDQAPPPDIPAKNILRQPGVRGTPVAAEAAAPAPAAPASAPRLVVRDKQLEERKKQAEAAEAEKTKALEAQVATAREENCKRARQSKANFESGQKVVRFNEAGERVALDDKQRAAEMRHLQDLIDRDCPR